MGFDSMSSADPPKPKRPRPKGERPFVQTSVFPPTPANDAGVSAFGVPLDDESMARGAKLSLWTVTEAVYFSAGCKPPNAELPIPSFSLDAGWLDEPVSYRRTLFERHLLTYECRTHIAPMEALELLHRRKEWVDPKMLQAILHFHAPKPNKHRKGSKASLGDYMLDDDDDEQPEALKRKLSTLRKILLGIAIEKFAYFPRKHFNTSAKVIEGVLKKHGINCTDETIGRHLKAAVEEHWVDPGA